MPGYGERFPPKNRTETGLGVLEIEISGRETRRFDPNSLRAAAAGGELLVGLGPPSDAASVLSGRPGYRYRDCEVDLVLAADELDRFVRRDLRPREYLQLRGRFGLFFQIHEDYFDEDTGEALQPLRAEPPAAAPPGRKG